MRKFFEIIKKYFWDYRSALIYRNQYNKHGEAYFNNLYAAIDIYYNSNSANYLTKRCARRDLIYIGWVNLDGQCTRIGLAMLKFKPKTTYSIYNPDLFG